ncbi:hypothetical protein CVT24_007848, partial [Panaeolus cyanescens]
MAQLLQRIMMKRDPQEYYIFPQAYQPTPIPVPPYLQPTNDQQNPSQTQGYELGITMIVKEANDSPFRNHPTASNPSWALVLSEQNHTFTTTPTVTLFSICNTAPGSDVFKLDYRKNAPLIHTSTSSSESTPISSTSSSSLLSPNRKLGAIFRVGFIPTAEIPRSVLTQFLITFSPNEMGDYPVITHMRAWNSAAYVLRLLFYIRQ